MNDNAKKWVEALESGRFQQAKGKLRTADGFCCLGVACEISGLGKWDHENYKTKTSSRSSFLPMEVKEWLGLGHKDGDLMILNDGGSSFLEIAALIRSEPKGLFKEETNDQQSI